jgi:hypothetical protein
LRPFVKIVDVQASEKSKAAGEPPLRSNEDLYRYFSERERRSGGTPIDGGRNPKLAALVPVCIMARWPTEERDVVRLLDRWQTPSRKANTTAGE